MGIDELISILWRRRGVFAIASGIALLAAIVTTLIIPKAYTSAATLFVGQSIEGDLATQTLDSTQGEQLSRTFTTLAASPEIADAVLPDLPSELTRTELLDRVTVSPVERTQLLEINAEAPSPEEAAAIANAYADVFVAEMAKLHDEGRVPTTVAVSARAVPPTSAAKPNVPLYIGFGLVLSLLLGAAVALGRDRLDRSIRVSPEEDSLVGQPILARVPKAPEILRLPIQQRIARDQLADSLRVLRTNIELTPGQSARAVLITSPRTGEGKTTIARELAMTIASDGDSVALVELDLRRPTLDLARTGTGVMPAEIGISEVLAGRASLDDAIQTSSELPGLAVIRAGVLAANPARLLRSQQSALVLGELRKEYDWVIIDTPPVLIADDVLLLTSHVDGAVLVVDATKTPLTSLRSALGKLQKVNARTLGVVLNNTAAEPNPYYLQASADPRARDTAARRAARRPRDRARS